MAEVRREGRRRKKGSEGLIYGGEGRHLDCLVIKHAHHILHTGCFSSGGTGFFFNGSA